MRLYGYEYANVTTATDCSLHLIPAWRYMFTCISILLCNFLTFRQRGHLLPQESIDDSALDIETV